MTFFINIYPNPQFNPNRILAYTGYGSDDAGNFSIQGNILEAGPNWSSGQVAFVKSYPTHRWRYQGRWDDSISTVDGVWGDDFDGPVPPRGPFKLRKMTPWYPQAGSPQSTGPVINGIPAIPNGFGKRIDTFINKFK